MLAGLIASRAKDPAIDASVIVSSLHDLLDRCPDCPGRLVGRPREFVRRVIDR